MSGYPPQPPGYPPPGYPPPGYPPPGYPPPGYPPPGYPPPGYPPPGYPPIAQITGPWQTVRTGMILVFIGLLVVAGADLLNQLLETSTIAGGMAKIESGDYEAAGKMFDRLELFYKVFPPFICVGLVLALIGAIGILRTPPPGNTGTLATFAAVGAGLMLLAQAVIWILIVSEPKGDTMKDLVKPLFMTLAVSAGLLHIMMALAIHGSLRRAGHPGALALGLIAIVLAGLFVIWWSYFILAEPKWKMFSEHPWRWFLINDLPSITRTVLVAIMAIIAAGHVRAIAAAPRAGPR